MEYSSFYGGRKGASFVIVMNFPTIKAMADNFRDASYSSVKFDEYVLIDTANKNNPDNGKVFKRGYGYNSGKTIQWFNTETNKVENIDAGGAQYVGRIGGSTGTTPQLVLTTYQDASSKRSGQNWEERKNTGSYTISNEGLVPGKDGTKYNDTIDWCSISMRDANAQDAIAYIGFKVPYLVDQFITSQISPYNENGQYQDQSSVQRVDDGAHPFYHKWQINLPKGIKGESLRNLRTMIPTSSNIIYQPGTTNQYSGFAQDVANSREILVYDSYVFDDNLNPTPVTYYLGSVNGITNLSLDEHGTLTVNFSHSNPVVYQGIIKWINNITFNEDINGNDAPGHVIITYNTLDENDNLEYVEGAFDFVNDISIDTDGTVTIENISSQDVVYNKLIKWINSITLDSTYNSNTEGTLTINYNTGAKYETTLQWVNGLEINAQGKMVIKYSGGHQDQIMKDSNNNDVVLRYIDSVSIETEHGDQDEGLFTVYYNTGAEPFTTNLHWVNGITMDQYGVITINYCGLDENDDPITETLDTVIKYVKAISLDATGNVTITYNTRNNNQIETEVLSTKIKWIKNISLSSGNLIFTYNTQEQIAGADDVQTLSLNYPTDFNINNTGQMSVTFADGTSQNRGTLKSLTNLSIDTSTQKLKAEYNTGTSELIGSAINSIGRVAINTNNNHLLIYYTAPEKRGNITYNNQTGWTDLGYLFDGVNINSKVTELLEQDIIIPNNFNIEITRWYGLGQILEGAVYFSLPLNKILTLNNPSFNITDGNIKIVNQSNVIAANSLSAISSSILITKTITGLNFIISGIVYNTPGTIPANDTIVGVVLNNVAMTITESV